MEKPQPTADDFLAISPRIRVLPIIHGSGEFAIRCVTSCWHGLTIAWLSRFPLRFKKELKRASSGCRPSRSSRNSTSTATMASRVSATCRSTRVRG